MRRAFAPGISASQAAPEEFGEVVRLLRKRGFTGANVTVPHKQAACSLCSDTDALSRATGSVNTLVFQQDGSVSGFNTDGPGFARAIREEFSVDLRDLKVALLAPAAGPGLPWPTPAPCSAANG